jgi:large subunit ribosomal protein L31
LKFHLPPYLCSPLNNRTAKSVQPKQSIMKQGIHPENYRFVVFKDMSNGTTFISRSTAATKETIKMEDGKEYPLVKLEISNSFASFLYR